jgi:hypothetical protein
MEQLKHNRTIIPKRKQRNSNATISIEDIPMNEWRKRFAMLPEEIVKKSFNCTTQYYLNAEIENRQDPRDHIKSRFPGLRIKRQNEMAASDTFFPSVVTNRGYTCSQLCIGLDSDRWEVYPLRNEGQNVKALQDYTRTVGAPTVLRTDNAQSEIGNDWTEHLRSICTGTELSEPHHPWQNPAERKVGALSAMVKNCMRAFGAPFSRHDYCQRWCCDVHNVMANRKLSWRTPLERNSGITPDISKFCFYFWEPIWYYVPSKTPKDSIQKARWLGFAKSNGDEFTYLIEPEDQKGRKKHVLVRSNIKTRRKNIGETTEYVNDDPAYADFFLSPDVLDMEPTVEDENIGKDIEPQQDNVNETIHSDEENAAEPDELFDKLTATEQDLSGLSPDEMERIYDQIHIENDIDYHFDRILDHVFKDGTLELRVQYRGGLETQILDVPFTILKKDVPLELARYIRAKVIDAKRRGFYNTWAKQTLRNHNR